MLRTLEWIFCIFFIINVVVIIFFDSMIVLPGHFFPTHLKELFSGYANIVKDSNLRDPPEWFQAIFLCEQVLHAPFSIAAAYAFYKGSCRWIRMPAIIYSTHVLTAVIAILYHNAAHDFSHSKYPGPSNLKERFILAGAYLPFLIIPLILLVSMLKEEDYGLPEDTQDVHTSAVRQRKRLKDA